jgi:tetratricopeptide (TPR) repeat protein/DNA-binding XRE family transcriptional regulator
MTPPRRKRLALRRKALGLTQEDLAAQLGVERSTVVRWERGETEPLPWIRPKLASALRVSADRLMELLGGRGPPGGPGPGGAGQAVPRQLPAAVAGFTGRAAELAALTRILNDAAGSGTPGTVVISAIEGTAGVGKTALALHWAHQVARRFGNGQLYANLRGFDPAGTPATPAEAICGFLSALGVPPERIPPAPDAQAALYRSLLADRQTLIVLDNARDEQQVRPLLPASRASLVLVTSRNQLSGLSAADGARLLALDVLTHAEAVQLLTARIGRARAAAGPDAIAEIATLCACLPLALTVAAARAAARPSFPLATVAEELRDTAGRLDILDAGDPLASVRTVFSWSYRQLSTGAARMFRLLGLHPGPDFTIPAAASLAAVAEPGTRSLLRELNRAHLITEHAPGRYTFHDLLRAYAADQAGAVDTEPERAAATGRLLDHYLHTAHSAAFRLEPTRIPIELAPPRPGVAPEQLASDHEAMEWFQAEHPVLVAAIGLAASTGFDMHAWQLPWTMADFLDRRGRWQQKVAIQRTAVAAATRLGDTAGQIESRRLLGTASSRIGDHEQARAHLGECLKLYQRVGDRRGEAKAHLFLGGAAQRQGRSDDALAHGNEALRLYQAIGDKAGEATLLNNIGYTHAQLGSYQQASVLCRRALALSAAIGRSSTEAYASDSLGYVEHHLGNFAAAASWYQRAIRLSQGLGDRVLEADALTHLGDTRRAAGELTQANQAWQQALAIFEDLQHPSADEVRAKLAGRAD